MDPVRVRPERTTLFAVAVALLGALPLGLSFPWTAPLLLLPLGWGVWVLRAGTTADSRGLRTCDGLRTRRFAWTDVERVDVADRRPTLVTTDGGQHRLPCVDSADLPRLLALSS